MRPADMRGGTEITVEVRPASDELPAGSRPREDVELRRVQDEVLLCWDTHVVPVVGVDARTNAALADAVDSGLPLVVWCARAQPRSLTLHIRRFHGGLQLAQPLVIGIDDACLDDLRRTFGVSGGALEASRWLEERLLLPSGPTSRRAAFSGGPKLAEEAFRMFGKGVAIDVRREGERLQIDRIVRNAPITHAPVHLLCAPISFADVSAAGALATAARHALEQAVRSSGSYLRVWSTYADMEEQAILRRAGRIGALRYESVERRSDGGFRFHLTSADDLETRLGGLDENDRLELEAGDSAPRLDRLEAERRRNVPRLSAPLLAFDAERGLVDLRAPEDEQEQPAPPKQGYLFLSLTGDRARLRRRQQAEERLRTGDNPLPYLGLLLEGQPGPRSTRKRRPAGSPAVLEAFGGRPTQKQLEALDVAINTPDIALIQGPPGTGKTKVITALQRRLAELAEEGSEVSHRILVSSAQHDAVENVVQRSDVFGLPAVKIGSRRGDDPAGIDGVEVFRNDRMERLRSQLRQSPDDERAAKARRMAVAYLRAPGPPVETASCLRELAAAVAALVPPLLRDRLVKRAEELTRATLAVADPEEHELRLAAAHGIRIVPAAFEDDGPVKAGKALRRLDALLKAEERELLVACAGWTDIAAPSWLPRVETLRDALLDRLLVPPPAARVEDDSTTRSLLVELADALEDRRMRSSRGEQGVLAAYLSDLENDPAAVREAIEHYTVVLAATCQQAASGAMRAVRGVDVGWPEFETVIVDEAARANPLDLFIPMTMARRRVVLVGDHRQLPHMLEPDVERDISAAVKSGDLAQEAEAALKESLFGRLWHILQKLEQHDGIQRAVRLDTQFRMHPVLGNFVSRMFYERGEDAGLRSGADAEHFTHRLAAYQKQGEPCVAAWIDVPAGPGKRERAGRSKSRVAEATRIAREVKGLMEAAPQLTFGVIAFYSAQVNAIARALTQEGLAEQTEAGGWRIAERWKRTENDRGELVERLRLGSVDAFQGKEFDVVFLSVTRSNDLPAETDEQRRRKYGHLLFENRLCVAMSRQRRLLVVVGDRDFAASTDLLPSLRAFSQLCEGPHGTLRS